MEPRHWLGIIIVLIIAVMIARQNVEHEPVQHSSEEGSAPPVGDWHPPDNWTSIPTTWCPQPRYLFKHVCDWCKTPEDSFKFSKDRRDSLTEFNTVLFPVNRDNVEVSYERLDNDSVCSNVETTRIDECDLLVEKKCVTRGFMCRIRHAPGSGHLWYRENDCFDWESYYPYTPPWDKPEDDSSEE